MFEYLSIRTREIVSRFCEGQPVEMGREIVAQFDDGERKVLRILACNLQELKELRGQELSEKFFEFFKRESMSRDDSGDKEHEENEEEAPVQTTTGECARGCKIGLVRACSFRGLAPAGLEWEHDFGRRSHLLYGPNGCGKSSLLGAISWCLTGCIFRDDRSPDIPEDVKAYSIEQDRRVISRPDALSLIDEAGQCTSPDDEYWVEMQLIGEDLEGNKVELWIRRNSKYGLSKSEDGIDWMQIESIAEAGMDELDGELFFLMPARVPHIRFGKDTKLTHILSQIVGLGDLETIADLAEKVCRALRTEATRINTRELAPEKVKIIGCAKIIGQTDNKSVRGLPSYFEVVADERKLKDIEVFGKAMARAIEDKKKQLARDLSIEIPEEDSPEYKECKRKLDNLPGQVQSAIDELEKPLDEIFLKSLGFSVPNAEELAKLERRLEQFEKESREKVRERLKWALKEREDAKASLMLMAVEHFAEGSNECPVCTQDLGPVPQIKEKLEELRPLVGEKYLTTKVSDLSLVLIEELRQIVMPELVREVESTISDRILSDWSGLKERVFKGFLLQIAEKFDEAVQGIAEKIQVEKELESIPFSEGYVKDFPGAFSELDRALHGVRSYIRLCKSVQKKSSDISQALRTLLTAPETEGKEDSLRVILERGQATNQDIISLSTIHKTTQNLWESLRKEKELGDKISNYRTIANSGEATKELAGAVRREVVEVVKGVEDQMKENFSRLYENEILTLDLLTTGHAANPNVKDEINAYLRAGNQCVPIAPFSNAGRMRALILSFIFALLKKSVGSLGIIVLDDPVLSLDHEHKARFVDHMVEPLLRKTQVMMATHYNDFYKVAERSFSDSERLLMPPRRREADGVSFEPGDLLRRVESTLEEQTCSWREVGNNLRLWAERTLATLSGYCPSPFAMFNDIPGSVRAYRKINDLSVATPERDRIVKSLESSQFHRIMHRLAHDEDPAESEVRDGLKVLKECEKAVRAEIRRFKGLYEHALLARAINARPSVRIISLQDYVEDRKLNIVARAAAAEDGVGVFWEENEICRLAINQVAILKLDTIAPIGLVGQYILLDSEEKEPANSDLVVVETQDKKRYVRRFWVDDDKCITLEAANLTRPYRPIRLSEGEHLMRRVVGVLFNEVGVKLGQEGDEWARSKLPDKWLDNVVGVRVEGTSMEPIAREGQIVLLRKKAGQKIGKADLACVDIADRETVIKRCYPSESDWVLCSINPNEVQDPISISIGELRHAYPLVGVLFEVNSTLMVAD